MYKLIIKVTNKIIIYSVCQESSVDISVYAAGPRPVIDKTYQRKMQEILYFR